MYKNDKAWVGLAMIHRQFGDLELAWANVEKLSIFSPAMNPQLSWWLTGA
jgi:hypothetical protein